MLYDKIAEYTASGVYPMHMPGHKGNPEFLPPCMPYDIDITEIHGFDDLHEPRGVLREVAELAASLYGSVKAFPLVNGSTVGILASIGALAGRGDKVLVTQGCHRSVYNAISLFGLSPIYMAHEIDKATGAACSVDPGQVEKALEIAPDIKFVIITSPTYEGVISDIRTIADIVHKRDIPLLVDSAHGAHLGFSGMFPVSAVQAGADAVVMSLHKTLPALTQCSLLHICSQRVRTGEVTRLLSVLQTSSPSYVLMASIDHCLRLVSRDKESLFGRYEHNLKRFDEDIRQLKNLFVLHHGSDAPRPGFFAFDLGKLVIITKNTSLSGDMLADILRTEHSIEPELSKEGFVIAMTSVCDSPEGFTRLANALIAIDRTAGRINPL